MRVVVVGAGGHGQVVADVLLRSAERGGGFVLLGYVDDDEQLFGKSLLDLPVLGPISDLSRFDHDAVVIAIGDNGHRRTLYRHLRAAGERFVIARHPSAVVAPSAVVGAGTVVCAGAIVNPLSCIGENVILNTGCSVDHHNDVGDHVHLAPGVHLGGDVTIGEGVLVGIGATVMPGRRLGAWSILGAGALAHRDIPSRAVALGVPARVVAVHANTPDR